MNQVLNDILALQTIDTDVIRIRRLQKAGPMEEERAKSERDKALALSKKQEIIIRDLKMKADSSDCQVKSCEAEMEKLKGKLRTIKNNKEFEIIRDGISNVEKRQSEFETITLECMQSMEDAEKKQVEFKADLAQKEETLARISLEVQEESVGLEKDIESIKAKRNLQKEKLPVEVLKLYESAIRCGKGIALAKIKNGTCQCCFQKQRPNICVQVTAGAQLVRCEGCGRFLYQE